MTVIQDWKKSAKSTQNLTDLGKIQGDRNSWTVLKVQNIITIIKKDPYLLITAKIRNKM